MSNFSQYLSKIGEYGEITRVKPPLLTVVGLPGVRNQELIYFENGSIGDVFSVYKEGCLVLLLT